MKLFLKSIIFIGIVLSLVAAFYSIGGLVAIFKGSPTSIMILSGTLEIAKVNISVYLHIFWDRARKFLIIYLTTALIILASITSLGIFGALSSAYFSSTNTSDIQLKINTIKSRIDIEQQKITNINSQIASIMSIPKEEKESWHYYKMNSLNKEITGITDHIDKLNEEMVPYKTEVNRIDSEVGPLKFLAQWIYGDTQDAIDKSVQLFIVLLVLVFDPLALLLIFAGIHGLHILHEEHITEAKDDLIPFEDKTPENLPEKKPEIPLDSLAENKIEHATLPETLPEEAVLQNGIPLDGREMSRKDYPELYDSIKNSDKLEFEIKKIESDSPAIEEIVQNENEAIVELDHNDLDEYEKEIIEQQKENLVQRKKADGIIIEENLSEKDKQLKEISYI